MNQPLYVPDFDKDQKKARRNAIALELLKYSMSSEEGCSVEVCFKLADEFIAREQQ